MTKFYCTITPKSIPVLAMCWILSASAFSKTSPGFKQQSSGIAFTENKGQVHDQNNKPRPDVLYGVMTGNMAVHIKNTGVSYQLYRIDSYKETEDPKTKEKRSEPDQQTIYRIDLNWLNCNKTFIKAEDEALPGHNNYCAESSPKVALNVISYKGVTLKNLYNGINLHYYEKNGQLKHDYIVAPNTDYKQIQLKVEGAEIISQPDGSLILNTPLGKVQEGAPLVYQNDRLLKAKWVVTKHELDWILSFEVENYNPNFELIIDPVTRLWGTYYGGSGPNIAGDDRATCCVTDANGNVFMAGYTNTGTSTLIATLGSHQSTNIGPLYSLDGFLVKFDANGVRLWGTYCGGLGDDVINGCAIDPSGNIFVAGNTNSTTTSNISTVGSHQSNYSGGYDAFLIKFSNSGLIQWGTYYGGVSNEYGYGCTTDINGNAYLCGVASAYSNTIIATPGSHQATSIGSDGFLVKFNSSGVRQWGTYYGISPASCCTDVAGNVFIAGTYLGSTSNTAIATPGSHQPVFGGTIVSQGTDACLVKFNSNGVRQWGTYYGTSGNEVGKVCAADAIGNVYLAGYAENNPPSTGTIISTPLSHQLANQGADDGFLVKFSPSGTRLWGTYYGGNYPDRINSCVVDSSNNVYIAGETQSFASNFVVSGIAIANAGGYQDSLGGLYQGTGVVAADAFLAKFNPSGVRQWGTYYGGASADGGNGCATDKLGHVYLCGLTFTGTNTVIATAGSHQSVISPGNRDAFLVKFDQCTTPPSPPLSLSGSSLICAGTPATFYTPPAYAANYYTLSLPGGTFVTSNTNTITALPVTSGMFTLMAGNACGVSPQQTFSITVNPLPSVAVNSGSICLGQSFTLVASGANSYTYSGGAVVTPSSSSSYTVIGTSAAGCSNSVVSTIGVNPLPSISINSGVICLGQSFTLVASGANTYTYSSGPVVSPILTSSYSATGASAAGCISSNTAISTITVSTVHPTITVNSGSICVGKSFTIIASGANTYTIQGGSLIVNPSATSSYTVAGTSTAGCISSNTAVSTVSVNPLPIINLSSTNSLLCVGESATLTASGASIYTFNPGGVGATITVSPSATTTYAVIGMDANGCSNNASISLSVDACTLIKNEELKISNSGLVLYPNPNTGIITIEMNTDNEVMILNALGQIVYSDKLTTGTHQINLEALANGIYVLRVTHVSGNIKLIKE
ncbi:MAG: SBBP repeat-containing protein [bacterium]|nr:SBBP repeat-containing protein [bacterium]